MTKFYQQLIQLKKNNPALWNGRAGGQMSYLTTNKPDQVLAFKRTLGNNSVYALFNLSNNTVDIQAEMELEGDFEDALTGEVLTLPTKLELNPWAYRIISVNQ